MIRLEPLDELLILRLDRPDTRNALTRPVISELTDALMRIAADATVRGVILAGAGRSFCAGVDLHEFAEGTPQTVRVLIAALAELCRTVRLLPQPVACAIQGHCLGGALEVAACCDFRVCTPDAQLGMPEVFLGIPSVIDAVMLGQLIGTGRARELLLAPDQDLVNVAAGLLRRVTRHSGPAIATQRRLHQQWLELPYSEAVEQSQDALVATFESGTPQRLAAARLR